MSEANVVSDFEMQNGKVSKKREGLTLNDIVAATGMDKSALYRYLSQPEIRKLLAPSENPVLYRRELMPVFQALAQAHKANTVRPKTAANLIEQQLGGRMLVSDFENQNGQSVQSVLMVVPESGIQKPRTEIRTEARQSEPDSEMLRDIMSPVVAALERMAASADSRKRLDLLTVSEVARLLQVSESWVSRHVPKIKLGRNVRYSREQIARFISDSEIK